MVVLCGFQLSPGASPASVTTKRRSAMASAASSRSFPRIAEVRAYVASVPDEKQHVSRRFVTSLGQGVIIVPMDPSTFSGSVWVISYYNLEG